VLEREDRIGDMSDETAFFRVDDGNDDEVVEEEEVELEVVVVEVEEGTDREESLRVGCSVPSFFGSIVPLVVVVEVVDVVVDVVEVVAVVAVVAVVDVVGVTLRQALDFLLSVELRSPNLAALSKNDF
jgi:hypothetical protein